MKPEEPKKAPKTRYLKPGWFAIAGHEWFPADWRATFKPEHIVRESLSGKSILVRLDWEKGEQPAVTKNSQDTTGVWIDARLGLDTLFFRAEQGDEVAANRLAELLRVSCSKFSRLCKERPKLFQRVARQSWRWPVVMSTHPLLCDKYKVILKDLQLGAATPLELDKYAKWKWDTAADIAFALLCYLWQFRKENRKPNVEYGTVGDVLDRLPSFADDSAKEWWGIARVVFLFSYPEPQSVPELAGLVKAPTKRRSPGRMKQAILDLLKGRFVSFAPARPSYRS